MAVKFARNTLVQRVVRQPVQQTVVQECGPNVEVANPLPKDAEIVGATITDFGGDGGAYVTIYSQWKGIPQSTRLGTSATRLDSASARKLVESLGLPLDSLNKYVSRNGEKYVVTEYGTSEE